MDYCCSGDWAISGAPAIGQSEFVLQSTSSFSSSMEKDSSAMLLAADSSADDVGLALLDLLERMMCLIFAKNLINYKFLSRKLFS